jgi:hypothetical protein
MIGRIVFDESANSRTGHGRYYLLPEDLIGFGNMNQAVNNTPHLFTTKQLAVNACAEQPEPLHAIYDYVHRWRPDVPEHSVRARLHEAVKDGTIVRVVEGVYFARSGEAQLLLIEGDAWNVMKGIDDDSLDLLLSDVPGKFGREWAGTGTTRPHALLGHRTYPSRSLTQTSSGRPSGF